MGSRTIGHDTEFYKSKVTIAAMFPSAGELR
jgi:hypothetical protein